jgi:hypothetical protein
MFYPAINTEERDMFLSHSFHQKMILAWYCKFTMDDALYIIIFYVLAKATYKYSFRLFMVSVVFFVYHCIDLFAFWWNYKQSHYFYWVLLLACGVGIAGLIYPFKEERIAKFKSLF